MPWFMGGYSDAETAFKSTMVNNPFCVYPRETYEWFLYASGLYFGELVRFSIWNRDRPDYVEMIIHHMATAFLCFGSAYANQIGIGAIIAWLHILTDVPISIARVWSTTHFDNISAFWFLSTVLTTFLYFRLICLPWMIFNIFTSPACAYPSHLSDFDIFL